MPEEKKLDSVDAYTALYTSLMPKKLREIKEVSDKTYESYVFAARNRGLIQYYNNRYKVTKIGQDVWNQNHEKNPTKYFSDIMTKILSES